MDKYNKHKSSGQGAFRKMVKCARAKYSSSSLRTKLSFFGVLLLLTIFFYQEVNGNFGWTREKFLEMNFRVHPYLSSDLSEGKVYKMLEGKGAVFPKKGCVWEIGSHDGVWNSNSYYLLNSLKFRGFLFEPTFSTFARLASLYARNPRVTLHNMPVLFNTREIQMSVFPTGLQNSVKDQPLKSHLFDKEASVRYKMMGVDAAEICKQLAEAFEHGECGETPFSALLVDAERTDLGIADRIHRTCQPEFDLMMLESYSMHMMKMFGWGNGYNELKIDSANGVFVHKNSTLWTQLSN